MNSSAARRGTYMEVCDSPLVITSTNVQDLLLETFGFVTFLNVHLLSYVTLNTKKASLRKPFST